MRFEQLGSAAEESVADIADTPDGAGTARTTGTPAAPGTPRAGAPDAAGEAATGAGGGPADPKPGVPGAAVSGGLPVPSSRYTVLPGQRTRANSLDIPRRPPAGARQQAAITGPAPVPPVSPVPPGSGAPEAGRISDTSSATASTAATAMAATAMPAVPEAPAIPVHPPTAADNQGPDAEDSWPAPHHQIAILVRVLCVLIVAVLLGHLYIPDVMGLGSLVDTFLPWSFVPLALLLPASLVSRNKWAIGAAVLSAAVWGVDFGPRFASGPPAGPHDLRILSQNVSADDPDLAGVAGLALAQNADVVVLEGMSTTGLSAADKAVPAAYPYHVTMYEFAVWSKFPVTQSQPIELAAERGDPDGAGSALASGLFGGLLKVRVQVGDHEATLYAVHLPQPSLSHTGFGRKRAEALTMLERQIHAEYDKDLIVVGGLDLAQTDRGMGDLLGSGTGLASAQAAAGSGFGFTWPSSLPMVRLDDVLTRGVAAVRSVVLGPVGPSAAHRPIEVDLKF